MESIVSTSDEFQLFVNSQFQGKLHVNRGSSLSQIREEIKIELDLSQFVFVNKKTNSPYDQKLEIGQNVHSAFQDQNILIQTAQQSRKMNSHHYSDQAKKQEEIMTWQQLASIMPDCAERTLLSLIIQTWNLHFQQGQEQPQGEINNQFNKLQQQLTLEDLENESIRSHLQTYTNYKQLQPDLQASVLEKMYKQLVQLDVPYLTKLIKENHKYAELIKDQDVYLFIGPTGSGKSTTIQFLSGCEMEVVKVHGLSNIQPKFITNKMLEKVKSSPLASSETLYITPVIVDTNDLGLKGKGQVTLCDCPGFGDDRGCEIDIANGIGILDGIRKCKSVKLVIVLGKKVLGGRLEGLKSLVDILILMIPNLPSYLECIEYIFTQYNEDEYDQIQPLIKSKYETLNEDDKKNKIFVAILENLLEKDSLLIIDPLKTVAKDILNPLIKLQKIKNPSEQFEFSISTKSMHAIEQQVGIHQKLILNATNRSDYEIVNYKLNDMLNLFGLLKYEYINSTYQDCIKYIKTHINKEYQVNKDFLIRCFNHQNELSNKDIIYFRNIYESAKSIQHIKPHISDLQIDDSFYLQELQMLANGLVKEIKEISSLNEPRVKVILAKLKTISNAFPSLKRLYSESQEHIIEFMNQILNDFKAKATCDSQEESLVLLKSIQMSMPVLVDHFNQENVNKYFTGMKNILIEHFIQIARQLNNMLAKQKLINEDSQIINKLLTTLQNASKTYNIIQFETNNLEQICSQCRERCLFCFNKLYTDIQDLLKLKDINVLANIEPIIMQMSVLQDVEIIQNQTSRQYYQTIEEIIGFIKQAQKDLDYILKEVLKKPSGDKFQDLDNQMRILQNAKWVDKLKPGVSQDVMNDISRQIQYQFAELERNMNKINLDLIRADNIDSACQQMSDINEMRVLNHLFPDICNKIDEINTKFLKKIDSVLVIIKQKFNLEQLKSNEAQILDYKKAEQASVYLENLKRSNLYIFNQLTTPISQQYDDFEDYIKAYKSYVLKEMDKSHEEIWSNTKHLRMNAGNINQRLKEIMDIDKDNKYRQVGERFEGRQAIINKWKNKLETDISVFNEKLEMLMKTKGFQEALELLEKARAMSELDEFAGDVKFSAIYKTYYNQIIEDGPKTQQEAELHLQTYNYQAAKPLFESISVDQNTLFVKQLKNLKLTLNSNVESLSDEVLHQLVSFFKIIESADEDSYQEQLQKICYNLKHFNNTSQLQNYFDDHLRNLIAETKVRYSNIISHGFNKLLRAFDTYLSHNCYNDANQLKHKIDFIKDALSEKYIGEEIIKEVNCLQEKIEKNLEQLYQEFKSIDFYHIRHNRPKEIINKLSLNDKNESYRKIIDKIENLLIDKFKQEINRIRNSKIIKGKESQEVKNISELVQYLPEKLEINFKDEINSLNEYISKQEKKQQDELQTAINNKDFVSLQLIYSEYNGSQDYANQISDIKNAMFLQSVDFQEEIYQSFHDRNIKELLSKIREFYIFHEQYKHYFANVITKQFETSKRCVDKFFQQEIDNLNLEFNNDYDDISPSKKYENSFESQLTELSFHEGDIIEQNPRSILQASTNIIYFTHFNMTNLSMLENMIDSFNLEISSIISKIGKYFVVLTNHFMQNISPFNAIEIKSALKRFQPRQMVLIKLRDNIETIERLDNSHLIQNLKGAKLYSEMSKIIIQKLLKFQTKLLNEDFNQTKDLLKSKRQAFYRKYKEDYQTIQSASMLSRQLEQGSIDLNSVGQQCKNDLYNKIQIIANKACDILSVEKMRQQECEEFQQNYNILVEVIEHLELRCNQFTTLIQRVKSSMNKKVEQLRQETMQIISDINIFKDHLIQIKIVSEYIHDLKQTLNKLIDDLLLCFKSNKNRGSGNLIIQLGMILDKDPIGKKIISDHKTLQGFSLALFNTKTQLNGIDYIINEIKGDDIDKDTLRKRFDKYLKVYQKLINENIKHQGCDLSPLIKQVIQTVGKVNHDGEIKISGPLFQKMPTIVAYVCAIWTLQNSDSYFDAEGENNQKQYLMQPHPAQVISIFRLLGVGHKNEKIQNHLVQIHTGEGKSVTLGITSCILALFGIDVSCACYSEYLSQRDYKAFQSLFEALHILPYIKYGTFNQICENIINQQGDIRKIVSNIIVTGNIDDGIPKENQRPKALLIDEVDVFFSSNYYGKVFTPSSTLFDPCISSLFDLIWKERGKSPTYCSILSTQEFQELCQKFKGWDDLLKQALRDILYGLEHFQDEKYIVNENKIGYQDGDHIVYNIKYGYHTVFAHYQEHSQGRISEKCLNQNKNLIIKCGSYSYAEIPHNFKLIVGVSGTLQTLNEIQQNVVTKEYKIMRSTFTPSVFGKNRLLFNEKQNVKIITSEDRYYQALIEEILSYIDGSKSKRVVLVFFEDIANLNRFLNSIELEPHRQSIKFLTEEASNSEKEVVIRNATVPGQITLLTKIFGRGTDFKGVDESVQNNGGVHVITTFLPEDLSEEIQIKGRTARQGEPGSFSMVLLEKTLEKYSITNADLLANQNDHYTLLQQKRKIFEQEELKRNVVNINQVKKMHNYSQEFLNELLKKNKEGIKPYLTQFNQGVTGPLKTLILMDMTGSMLQFIDNTKNTIQTMFQRLGVILQSNGINESRIMVQIAGYRNYNSRDEDLLVHSSWESNPEKLKQFLENKVQGSGGMGDEAIEIGLQHANRLNQIDPISQVILIGDAACNAPQETINRRKEKFGEEYWKTTRFPQPTSDQEEIKLLQKAKIPVHAFYVKNNAQVKACFEQYAKATSGRIEFLDVNSPKGAQILTDLITEEILRKVGFQSGQGDEFVAQYHSKYGKSYS